MCPPTGSIGSTSPRYRSPARASSSSPERASAAAPSASSSASAPGDGLEVAGRRRRDSDRPAGPPRPATRRRGPARPGDPSSAAATTRARRPSPARRRTRPPAGPRTTRRPRRIAAPKSAGVGQRVAAAAARRGPASSPVQVDEDGARDVRRPRTRPGRRRWLAGRLAAELPADVEEDRRVGSRQVAREVGCGDDGVHGHHPRARGGRVVQVRLLCSAGQVPITRRTGSGTCCTADGHRAAIARKADENRTPGILRARARPRGGAARARGTTGGASIGTGRERADAVHAYGGGRTRPPRGAEERVTMTEARGSAGLNGDDARSARARHTLLGEPDGARDGRDPGLLRGAVRLGVPARPPAARPVRAGTARRPRGGGHRPAAARPPSARSPGRRTSPRTTWT